MAKKKRVKVRRRAKANVKSSNQPRGSKIKRSFYTFLCSLLVSLVFFSLSAFIGADIWLVTFVMLGLLFGVLALAFLLIWLVLLVMKWMKK